MCLTAKPLLGQALQLQCAVMNHSFHAPRGTAAADRGKDLDMEYPVVGGGDHSQTPELFALRAAGTA